MTEPSLLIFLGCIVFIKLELVAGFLDPGYWKHWLIGQVHCSTTESRFTTRLPLIWSQTRRLTAKANAALKQSQVTLNRVNIGFVCSQSFTYSSPHSFWAGKKSFLKSCAAYQEVKRSTGKYKYLFHCTPSYQVISLPDTDSLSTGQYFWNSSHSKILQKPYTSLCKYFFFLILCLLKCLRQKSSYYAQEHSYPTSSFLRQKGIWCWLSL